MATKHMKWDPRIDPTDQRALEAATKFLLETLGISYTQEVCDQLMAFMECLKLYDEGTQKYGELWRTTGAIQNFYDAYRKSRRTWQTWSRQEHDPQNLAILAEENLDDPLDAVNYLLFGIRNARACNFFEEEDDG